MPILGHNNPMRPYKHGAERWGWVRWDLATLEAFANLHDSMMRSSQTGMLRAGGREAHVSSVPSSLRPSLAGG